MLTRRYRKQERHAQILLELKLKPHVRVAELAKQFGVTTETVRRDFEELGRSGLLQKAHGGASAQHPGAPSDLDERRHQRVAERERLGRFAASTVKDGTSIMIDAGATTMEFARILAFRETQIIAITNSLQVAMILGQSPKADVRLTPGEYLPREAAVIGLETCEYLEGYNVDACFLGATGISDVGVTEAVKGFASVKRAMIRQSRRCNFLIDASKFGQTHLTHVAKFDEIDTLISDKRPAAAFTEKLEKNNIKVLVPNS